MHTPPGLRYSSDHEWVRVEGARAVIGITDFAQSELGDVVYVGLPEIGTQVDIGATFSEVESTKSVSDIFAPLTGAVAEVNDALEASPELVNSDPYGEGWICVIEMTDATQLDELLDADAYSALTES